MSQRKIINEIPVEKIIKGFANKKRLDIISLLDSRPNLSVENISEILNLEYKNVSAHLNKLANTGIVLKNYQSNTVIHSLTKRGKAILQFVRIIE